MSCSSIPTIALYGGDGRLRDRLDAPARLRAWAGSKSGGRGALSSLEDALRSGAIDAVVVLTKWVGHTQLDRVKRLCARFDVPLRFVNGGLGAASRVVARLLAEVLHGR